MLSLLEFQSLIDSGAVVHCTTKEECVKVLDFLEQLGFYIHEHTSNLSNCPTYLSPGIDRSGTEICRYSNEYVEEVPSNRLLGFYKDSSTVIEFDEVPFEKVRSQQSDDEFDECFARLLTP